MECEREQNAGKNVKLQMKASVAVVNFSSMKPNSVIKLCEFSFQKLGFPEKLHEQLMLLKSLFILMFSI